MSVGYHPTPEAISFGHEISTVLHYRLSLGPINPWTGGREIQSDKCRISPVLGPIEADRRVKANVARLAVAQALAGANASVIFATGGLIGSTLTPDQNFATVPVSCFVVGMAAGTLPTGWVSRHHGRRTAFIIGTGCGAAAGLLAALAVLTASFGIFCFATFLGGVYGSVSQSFRFAAADGASPTFRPKALSWVMAGGVFAGVLGPQLVNWTMDIWPIYLFAGSYLAQAGVALVAMAVLSGVDLSKPPAADAKAGRPLVVIVRQPRFLAAAVCGVVSYALMNLLMTSAPLAMRLCGLSISDSNLAIQWHVVAMYGPSFFTGALIARFGAMRVVAMGLAIIAFAGATGLLGTTVSHFWVGLILLGLGWNFGFVGASAMVLDTHRPEERNKVQAFNDFIVFGTVAFGSFSSGHLLATHGWAVVNWTVFPFVVMAVVVLTSSGLFRRGSS
jgi:MFS family permease